MTESLVLMIVRFLPIGSVSKGFLGLADHLILSSHRSSRNGGIGSEGREGGLDTMLYGSHD
jgi:hypothetical protein